MESAACLDVLVARKLIAADSVAQAKEQLSRIVQMLMGMLRRFSERPEFLRKDAADYGIEREREHEHDYEGRNE
ncbi:MAG: hypothetical protein ACR2NX_01695 [Chthoniobacterales bacterium]